MYLIILIRVSAIIKIRQQKSLTLNVQAHDLLNLLNS